MTTPPLKLGPLAVDPPVVLAPMAGVTNAAFRRLCRTYGAGLYVSEMVTARALVEGNAKTLGMVAPDPDEPCMTAVTNVVCADGRENTSDDHGSGQVN